MSRDRDLHRRARRKISKQGNSSMIAIPPEFMEWMHVYTGDDVEMIYDDEYRGFFVRPLQPRTFRPDIVGAANVR